ncbi:hypothetical protein ABPG72_000536 [Tetrahymena utriculariae]
MLPTEATQLAIFQFLDQLYLLDSYNQILSRWKWYLCILQKNSKLIKENNNITPHQKSIIKDIINSYDIDEQSKKIKLLPRSDFKTVQNLKDYLTRLLNINPVLKEISDGQVIVEYIQQEVNENKRQIQQINKAIQNTVSIDDISMNIPIPRDKYIIEKIDVYNQIDKLFEKEQVVILKGFGGSGNSTCAAIYGRNKDKEAQKVIWFYAEDGLDNDYEWQCDKINLDGKKYTEKDLKELINIVGKLPLRLALSGGYLAVNKLTTVAKYIEKYDQLSQVLNIKLHTGINDQSLAITSILSLETLQNNQLKMMEYAIYLNPDFIQLDILKDLGFSQDNIQENIIKLSELSLLKYFEQEEAFMIHMLDQQNKSNLQTIVGQVAFVFNSLFPYLSSEDYDIQNWRKANEYIQNVEYLLSFKNEQLDVNIAKLFDKHGSYLASVLYVAISPLSIGSTMRQMSDYNNSKKYLSESLDIIKQVFGEKDALMAHALRCLGQTYQHKRDYDDSVKYLNECLDIFKQIFGEEHQYMVDTLIDLGLTYFKKKEYDSSIEYFNECLDLAKQVFGEKSANMSKLLNNLGFIYLMKGEYDNSIKYFNESFDVSKEIFGEKHTHVALINQNLGVAYQSKGEQDSSIKYSLAYEYKGEYDNSIKYYNQSLDIRKQVEYNLLYWAPDQVGHLNILGTFWAPTGFTVFGEKHAEVAATLNNLGVAYQNKGKYDSSIKYYNQSLDIRKQIFGEKHADVAFSLYNLGLAYQNKREYDSSIKYNNESLDIRKQVFGENHAEVAATLNNLGNAYQSNGEYDNSTKYNNENLNIKKQIFGERHDEMADTLYQLGLIYKGKGEYYNSIKYLNEILDIYKQVFGEKHVKVTAVLIKIDLIYLEKGQFDNSILNQSLDIRKQILGEKHVEVADPLNNLGLTYQYQKDCDNSMLYLNESLDITKQVF